MRRRVLLASAAAAVLVSSGVITHAYVNAQTPKRGPEVTTVASSAAPPSGGSASPAASPTTPSARPSPSRTPEEATAAERLETALAPVAAHTGGRLSLAVLDCASGVGAGYGDDGTFDTASIVKVDILAALLLGAQDEGRELTAQEKAYARVMIENSDNAAATALWGVIGRAGGLDDANKRFGLTDTSGGDGYWWGLTRTTAEDQLRLLEVIFGPGDSPLDDSSRTYLRQLTEGIAEGQDWGVTAAADPGTRSALKNGWLPRSTTGLWVINSIGRVDSGGRTYLVAVLSSGHATQAAGVAVVEEAARTAVDSLHDTVTTAAE
jgi:hypothetical protein